MGLKKLEIWMMKVQSVMKLYIVNIGKMKRMTQVSNYCQLTTKYFTKVGESEIDVNEEENSEAEVNESIEEVNDITIL